MRPALSSVYASGKQSRAGSNNKITTVHAITWGVNIKVDKNYIG